jgi:hypothetical protein
MATKSVAYYDPEIGNGQSVSSIKGYTYSLINSKVEKEKLSKKSIFKENKNKYYSLKKITMPNIRIGTVIEIKYKLVSPYANSIDDLQFQYGIPVKKLDYKISITKRGNNVLVKSIEVFFFNNTFENTKTAIYAISYEPVTNSLEEISNISNDLKNHDCEILFESKTMLLEYFISENLFFGKKPSIGNSSLEQYAGSRFKNYLVVDFENENFDRDHLLYELGTSSKIGTISENTIEAPSSSYINKVLENKISCFNNYECLTLLNSFTVVGTKNYDINHVHTHSTWNDIYFSIYIFNLYVKCSLQILLNDFTSDAMSKRREFQEFYNKYYFKKISYNFLPNEIFKRISDSLEIEEDLEFIQNRLETLATQVNEKQQKQQEFLLFCISVIALLETPLHIEGIREIIGIENLSIYNSLVYPILILTLAITFIFKSRKK